MKYIDAEKLQAEIERLKEPYHPYLSEFENGCMEGRNNVLDDIISFITSLRQEQPESSNNLVDVDAVREDFITEVYSVLDADPTNDRANAIIDAFDSLPTISREQPKVDLVAELKHHLSTTPKEQLEKEWKELEPWCNIGPTVQEFLYGKQPEVDLEKEIQDWCKENVTGVNPIYTADSLIYGLLPKTALHFYERGSKARKK